MGRLREGRSRPRLVGAAAVVVVVIGAGFVVGRPDPAAEVPLLTASDARPAEERWDYAALSTGGDDPTEYLDLLGPAAVLTHESFAPHLDLTVLQGSPRVRERSVRLPRVRVGGAPAATLPAYADDESLVWLPREPVEGRLRAAVVRVEDVITRPDDGGRAVQLDADLSAWGDDVEVSRTWLADGRLWFLAGDHVGSTAMTPASSPREELAGVRTVDVAERVAWVEDASGPLRVRDVTGGDVSEVSLTQLAGLDCVDARVEQLRTAGDLVAVTLECPHAHDRLVVHDLRDDRTRRVRADADAVFDLSPELVAVVLAAPELSGYSHDTFVLQPSTGRWVRLAPNETQPARVTVHDDLVASDWGAGDEQNHLVARVHLRREARPEPPLTRKTAMAFGLFVGRGIGLDEVLAGSPGIGNGTDWLPRRALVVDVILDGGQVNRRRLRAVAAPPGTESPLRCDGAWHCAPIGDDVRLAWRPLADVRGLVRLAHEDPDGLDVLEVRGQPVTGDPRSAGIPGLSLDDLVALVRDPRFGLAPDADLEADAADYYGVGP